MRPVVGLVCLALGSMLLLAGCARLNLFRQIDAKAPDGLCAGAVAPELDAPDFHGNRVRLSDCRGKVVAVVFWASDCPPCRAMIPHERELVERHRGKPFVLIGVNGDANHDAARRVIAAENMTWPICKSSESLNQLWKVRYLPAVYVIDARGVIRFADVRGPSLESAINTLLAEMKEISN